MEAPRCGVVIAGGELDPNLASLIESAARLGIPVVDMRVPLRSSPSFEWTPCGTLYLDEAPVEASGAFLRYDVFSTMQDGRPVATFRAEGWFAAIQGWALSDPVRMLNKHSPPACGSKPAVLVLASKAGLRIPRTVVTNASRRLSQLGDLDEWIAKPVAGGGYCRALGSAHAAVASGADAPMPAIVQRRLSAPELRLYVVGSTSFAFELTSASLDYRERQDADIQECEVPSYEDAALRRLMALLGMDFGAADFKRDRDTGEWVFLELNTSPMFARFDEICGGGISEAILRHLS